MNAPSAARRAQEQRQRLLMWSRASKRERQHSDKDPAAVVLAYLLSRLPVVVLTDDIYSTTGLGPAAVGGALRALEASGQAFVSGSKVDVLTPAVLDVLGIPSDLHAPWHGALRPDVPPAGGGIASASDTAGNFNDDEGEE